MPTQRAILTPSVVAATLALLMLGATMAGAFDDANTRLITVYPNHGDQPPTDANTRFLTVYPDTSGTAPWRVDAITRFLTVYPDTLASWYSDALTREYSIWYHLTPETAPDGAEAIPLVFTVLPARPNPAGSVTSFRLGLPTDGPVRLELYDATGRRVYDASPAERLRAGWHVLDVQTARLSNGVYFCRIEAGGETNRVKVVVRR